MTQLLRTIILAEGITHIEDLSVREFIRAVESLSDKIVTEKLDGQNLWFGLDDKGFYTSREGKSSKAGRFYGVDDYKMLSAYNGFRAAHLALEKVEPIIRKYLKINDAVEIEVLFGRQPNTVTYGSEGKNYIVLLRGVHNTPEERVQNLATALDGKEVSVSSTIVSSQDGDNLDKRDETLLWKFTKVQPISAKHINTKDAVKLLDKLKAYVDQSNSVFSDKTNGEVAEMNLTSVPKGSRAEAKAERERVNAEITNNYKLPIKELLLKQFVRKIKPMLQDPELHPSEDIGVEGVVVRDPITGNQTKIVDRDVFTAINSFNAAVRSGISSLVRTADSSAPLEARGGVFGSAKIKIAELLGAPDLAVPAQARRFLTHYKKSDPAATALALANHLDIKSVPAARTKISSILKNSLSEINDILGQFKKEAGEYRLKLKTGKSIGITPEVMGRTLTAFAETKKEINEINSKVLSSRTAAQLLLALYGRTISSLFNEGDMEVKESFELIKSIHEDDGGAGGGDGGTAATSAGDVAALPKRIFQNGKEIIKRPRNFTRPPKFPAPKGSNFSLIKSVNEDWAHVNDMKFATDVDDTSKATSDVEFSNLRNTVNMSDSITSSDVSKYLDKAHEINDQVDSVAYGLEDSSGKIVKVYVNATQAQDFENAMSQLLGQEDDIEQAINTLAQKFDIVDVEWPEGGLNSDAPTDGVDGQGNSKFAFNDINSDEAQTDLSDLDPLPPIDGEEEEGEESTDVEGGEESTADIEDEDSDDSEDDGVERDDFGQIIEKPAKKKKGEDDEDEDGDEDFEDFEDFEDVDGDDDGTSGDEDESADVGTDDATDEDSDDTSSDEDEDEDEEKPKKKKTEESVSLHQKVLSEDNEVELANPTLQAISDMLVMLGFDLNASRAFTYQAKQLQARNSPALVAAKNSSIATKQRAARDALANAVKLAPGAAPAQTAESKFSLLGSLIQEGVWERLVRVSTAKGGDVESVETEVKRDIERLSKEGWTDSEIFELLKHLENVDPSVPEDKALERMDSVRKRVADRLK